MTTSRDRYIYEAESYQASIHNQSQYLEDPSCPNPFSPKYPKRAKKSEHERSIGEVVRTSAKFESAVMVEARSSTKY
jgi:hypothetical protein